MPDPEYRLNIRNSKLSTAATACLLALLLSSCATTKDGRKSVDSAISDAVENQGVGAASQQELTPEYYINLASQAQGEERQGYLMRAAELLIQRGDIDLAQDQLRSLDPESLERTRRSELAILAARIALKNNNPLEAIELLPDVNELTLPQRLAATRVEADANHQLGYYRKSAQLLLDIDVLFEADDLREKNHQGIWKALSSLPEIGLDQMQAEDATTEGWIALARLFSNPRLGLGSLQQGVLDWGTDYPEHPVSNNFIDSIIDQHLANRQQTDSIAVLLPLTGKLAAVSDAIRSGLLAAHYQAPVEERPAQLRFYDTGDDESDFQSLYDRAIDDGAHTIIGPIDKVAINRLAQKLELDVPVLTLNYAENAYATTGNLYQFGLLPEDEAEQAAEMAIKDGRERAAILVPASEWGERMQAAFTARFKQLGGNIVNAKSYDHHKDDYRKPIQTLFDIDDSNRRHRDLQRLLDSKLKFEPHRRQDVDMIFLAANSRSARGIMPAFKFHHAGDLSVYATSSVYTGEADRAADRDLNGILFCELPWNISTSSPLRASFDKDWPEHRSLTRLFAMGIDAYHLASSLVYLGNNEYARFQGETGNLYLDEYGRIHRELVWAQFRGGLPEYIDTYTAPERVDNDEGMSNEDPATQTIGTEGTTGRTGVLPIPANTRPEAGRT